LQIATVHFSLNFTDAVLLLLLLLLLVLTTITNTILI